MAARIGSLFYLAGIRADPIRCGAGLDGYIRYGIIYIGRKEMEIVLNKKQCSRIRTSEDLSDIYAYFERDYKQGENETDEEFLKKLPTYSFKAEQERIDSLMGCICYIGGEYNKKNVKRILGKRFRLDK